MDANSKIASPRKRSWLKIILAVLATLVLAVLALPLFVNADAHRPEIEQALARATGRHIVLGKIRLRIFGAPTVIVDDFQMSGPEDFAAGAFIAAQSVRARLSWSALLRDKFLVTYIEFDQPVLVLATDDRGRNNFSFGSRASDPASEGAAVASQASASRDFQISPSASITLVDAEIDLLKTYSAGSQPAPLLILHGLNLDLSDFIANREAPARWSARANLTGARADCASLAAPIAFAGGAATLAHGALDATFRAQAAGIADIKGTIHVSDITRGPTSFEISTPALDARALVAALRKFPAPALAHAAAIPPLDATAVATSALLAAGRITADRVDWAPYAGGNASAEIRFYSDHTEVWPASVTLYGGTVDFTARTDARQHPERFSANFQLRTLDLSRLLSQAPSGLRGKISGLADIDLELLGSADSAWRQAVTGTGHFSIRNGKLPGPHIGGTLGHLANAAGLNEIPFRQISANIALASGRAAINQGAVDSSLINATYSGNMSLADLSLDLAGVARINPSRVNAPSIRALLGAALQGKAAAATLPFTLRGAISNPIFASGHSSAADTRPPSR